MITAIRADERSNLQNNTGTNDGEPLASVIGYKTHAPLFFSPLQLHIIRSILRPDLSQAQQEFRKSLIFAWIIHERNFFLSGVEPFEIINSLQDAPITQHQFLNSYSWENPCIQHPALLAVFTMYFFFLCQNLPTWLKIMLWVWNAGHWGISLCWRFDILVC